MPLLGDIRGTTHSIKLNRRASSARRMNQHNAAMPITPHRIVYTLTAVLLSFCTWSANSNPTQSGQISHPCTGPSRDVSLDSFAIYKQLNTLYEGAQFDQLEMAMTCLMTTTERLKSGHSGANAVYAFYRIRMPAPGVRHDEPDRVNRWRKAKPQSLFAEFASLRLNYALAWSARSSGFAAEVSPRAWHVFYEGLSATERALKKASPSVKQTPLWQQLLFATLQDQPDSRGSAEAVFAEGVRKWPGFYDLYEAGISRTTPYWNGSWARTEEFADRWSRSLADTEGDSLYARLYLHLAWWNGIDPRTTHASWPRLRLSLIELVERYPTAMHINLAASLACLYSDQEAYRKVIKGIPAFMTDVWLFDTDFRSCTKRLIP